MAALRPPLRRARPGRVGVVRSGSLRARAEARGHRIRMGVASLSIPRLLARRGASAGSRRPLAPSRTFSNCDDRFLAGVAGELARLAALEASSTRCRCEEMTLSAARYLVRPLRTAPARPSRSRPGDCRRGGCGASPTMSKRTSKARSASPTSPRRSASRPATCIAPSAIRPGRRRSLSSTSGACASPAHPRERAGLYGRHRTAHRVREPQPISRALSAPSPVSALRAIAPWLAIIPTTAEVCEQTS